MKVLVIDDALFTRKVYCKILSKDFEIFEASNGEEGLRLCKEIQPDLVICDLLMPGLSGFQFLTEYSKLPTKAPVIICTSDVQEETREKCFELGADEFIQKPSLTDSESFLKILHGCLSAEKTKTK
jgi:twitching motility two-component system response regulator PilH